MEDSAEVEMDFPVIFPKNVPQTSANILSADSGPVLPSIPKKRIRNRDRNKISGKYSVSKKG